MLKKVAPQHADGFLNRKAKIQFFAQKPKIDDICAINVNLRNEYDENPDNKPTITVVSESDDNIDNLYISFVCLSFLSFYACIF